MDRVQYVEIGYDVIPLKPKSKNPLRKGWQSLPSYRQWKNAPDNANIGLRAGGGKAFFDLDDKNDPKTTRQFQDWMYGLGYKDFPVVQTASGVGRHVYVNYTGPTLLGSKRELPFGAGDFRYGPGSFVACPPDVIEGQGSYKLLSGDLARLPKLDLADIEKLFGKVEKVDSKPPSMSRLARALAAGKETGRYKSRSEAEGALVLSLINSGFDYGTIRRIFDSNPCAGKYRELKAENAQNADRWLYMVYRDMLKYSENESLTRREIRELQNRAELAAWGRVTDKNVFLAHTEIAYRAGRLEFAAASRDLAVIAGVSYRTASRTTKRLIDQGLLELTRLGEAGLANVYALDVDKKSGQNDPLPKTTYVGEWDSLSQKPDHLVYWPKSNGEKQRIANADAFRNGKNKLGQRAGQIYEILLAEALTVKELTERAGCSIRTARRALKKLSKVIDRSTGEIIEMVKREGTHWKAEPVDLDLVAAIMQTYGARGRQKAEYDQERREHARMLELGSIVRKEN